MDENFHLIMDDNEKENWLKFFNASELKHEYMNQSKRWVPSKLNNEYYLPDPVEQEKR